MAGLLPFETEVDLDDPDADPRVVGVDTTAADEVLGALSSGTARQLMAELHDEPATPSTLADAVDTSLQNAQYHLGNLEEAELIEVRGTQYSEKGREMNVYAPTDGPLVLFAGDEEESAVVETALAQLLGGIGLASLAGGVMKWWVTNGPGSTDWGGGGEVEISSSADLKASAMERFARHIGRDPGTQSMTQPSGETAFSIAPGVALVVGAVLALTVVGVWWGLRE